MFSQSVLVISFIVDQRLILSGGFHLLEGHQLGWVEPHLVGGGQRFLVEVAGGRWWGTARIFIAAYVFFCRLIEFSIVGIVIFSPGNYKFTHITHITPLF